MTPSYLTHNGETLRIFEWADRLGISRDAMLSRHCRFKAGKIGEEKLFQVGSGADNNKDFLEHGGIRDTTENWAKRLGVNPSTFRGRVKKFKKGKMSEKALFTHGTISETDRDRNVVVDHDGIRDTVSGWARRLNISGKSMGARICRFRSGKMSELRCFSYGHLPDERVRIEFGGQTYTKQGLARKLGVSTATVDGRLRMAKNGLLERSRVFTKGNIPHADRKFVRNKRYVLADGERVSIRKLADLAEVSFGTIKSKLDDGMSADEIYTWATDAYRHVNGACWFRGKKESIDKAVSELGIDGRTVSRRVLAGWSFADAVSEPRVPLSESLERARSSRRRNRRISELKQMGIIV